MSENQCISSDDDEEIMDIPVEIKEKAKAASLGLLPAKSRKIYETEYELFMGWCKKNRVMTVNETALLAYLNELSKRYKNSSLWSKFSMLKAVLSVNDNIDVNKFLKLKAFLKRHGTGYRPKKSKIFERSQIENFIQGAPNDQFLMIKVVLILGLAGACRREELYHIKMKDIERKESMLIVKIPDSKTHIERIFTVLDLPIKETNPLEIYDKYAALRPAHTNHDSFFVQYRKGKCSVQRVGINQFSIIPSIIAKYLQLPNPKCYTGHAFRRSSASLLAGTGADILSIKRHGGWKSSAVAESYIEENIEMKAGTSRRIFSGTNVNMNVEIPNTSKSPVFIHSAEPEGQVYIENVSTERVLPAININNIHNSTIQLHFR